MTHSKSPEEIRAYQLLGLKEDASIGEVRQTFKDLAFQFHPDRNPNNPLAEENFKKVAQAYALLSGNREMFLALEKPVQDVRTARRFTGDIFGDIFDVDAQTWNARNQDVSYVITLSARAAKKAHRKNILVMRELFCPACAGSGSEKGSHSHLCTYCFGTGFIEWGENDLHAKQKRQCPKCLGFGRLSPHPCAVCKGRGVRSVAEKIKVDLPSHVLSGQEVRLKSLGSQSKNTQTPGDLILHLRVLPETSFTFDGARNLCEILSKFLKKLKHFLFNS